jgi:hypothetical protein
VSHLTRLVFTNTAVCTLSHTTALGLLLTQHTLCTLAGNAQAARTCRKFLHVHYAEFIGWNRMNSVEGSPVSPTLWQHTASHIYVFSFLPHTPESWDSSVGIAIRYGLDSPGIESRQGDIFCTHSDWPWGPPILLYNGHCVFSRGKAAGTWHWPPTPI